MGVVGPCWSSDDVSFLCLMMILFLSWLGEGRVAVFESIGFVRSRSVCVCACVRCDVYFNACVCIVYSDRLCTILTPKWQQLCFMKITQDHN